MDGTNHFSLLFRHAVLVVGRLVLFLRQVFAPAIEGTLLLLLALIVLRRSRRNPASLPLLNIHPDPCLLIYLKHISRRRHNLINCLHVHVILTACSLL